MVISKFGDDEQFMMKVNPDAQIAFGNKPEIAVTGDYPTLTDIDIAYGKDFAVEWLIPQLTSLSRFAGAQNITGVQNAELARLIASEYHYLKVTELMLFFYRFKNGCYGRFYGAFDPLLITCALREFITDRNRIIEKCEQTERERRAAEHRRRAISYDEYLRRKEAGL